MPTLYLHIGTPKTATTAIQAFCMANEEAFQKRGFSYPHFPWKFKKISMRRNGHFLIGRIADENGARDIEAEKKIQHEAFDTIEDLFQTYDNVILSDEGLWHGSCYKRPDLWKELKEEADARGFQVKIIVYLRSQDAFATSWWNQQMKEGYNRYRTMRWQEFAEKNRMILHYYEHLEKMAEHLGKENIIVRVFDKKHFRGAQKNIYSDFLEVFGLTLDDDFILEEPEHNMSLNGNAHEVKRIINGLPDFTISEKTLVGTAIRVCAAQTNPEYKYSMMSPEEQAAFMEKYEEGNQKIAREYLGDKEGVLFFKEKKNLPKYTPDNPYMYEDIIRYFGEVTLLQQKMIADLQAELQEQKKIQKEQLEKLDKKLSDRMNRVTDALRHPLKSMGHLIKK